jgi:hypothetical protein
MPVIVEWDNHQKTIMRMTVAGRWTWDEMYQSHDAGQQLLNGTHHHYDVIIDWSKSEDIPPAAITSAKAMLDVRNPYIRATVFVGTNRALRALWGIFCRIYRLFVSRNTFLFADTMDEARALLAGEAVLHPAPRS